MYIDPNSGGILFQALAALLTVVSGFFWFFLWANSGHNWKNAPTRSGKQ